ncbi:MAG: glycosyltransferase [Candidatus Sericytochromatia bacterium]|nr:glycosyltransferase [Candidatus Sericytochromatia bacterium]
MITVVYCTRKTNSLHQEHLIKSSGLDKNIEIIEIVNNGESLSKSYNIGLKQSKNNIVVFCHDDLKIETENWGYKLLEQFNTNPEYGIIGVAGSKNVPSSGKWWENTKKLYGIVAHTYEGKTWLSKYSSDLGQDIEEVIIVDGVFFVIDKNKIKTYFNETVAGFHFYDVTFCFENFIKGVKIGVITSIRINHKSLGIINEAWESNRIIFVKKFENNLPANIKKNIDKEQKSKILIAYLVFENCSKEKYYLLKLIEDLKQQNTDISLISNVDKNLADLIKKSKIKLYSFQNPPYFKIGDGKWSINREISEVNKLYKINENTFDVLYVNHKSLSEYLLNLYPAIENIHHIPNTY